MKSKKTLKLLFLDPNRISLDNLSESFKDLPIIIIFEEGAHPAYIVDTGIEIKPNHLKGK